MVASVLVITGMSGVVGFVLAAGWNAAGRGLVFGVLGIAAPLIASDVVTDLFYRGDPLISPRRVNIISFVWCISGGVLFILVGAIAGLLSEPDLLLRGVVLMICTSAGLRTLIYTVFSTRGTAKTALAIVLQPTLLAAASWALIPTVWQIPPFVLVAVAGLTLLGPAILLLQISKWAFVDGTIKIIPLFRAFIYAWAEQHSEPLEEQLASVSETTTLEIDELTFKDPFEKVLGRLVAPYVHPGPFRNVGSSGLSLSLTQGLGMETVVVHGISSHEKDLPRSGDVSRLISALKLANANTRIKSRACTPMTRAEVGGAKASCQIFGDTAFFTLTLAPKSHDDIPDAAKDRIREAVTSHGLSAIVADAHNCLLEEDLLDNGDVNNLVAAALAALEKADKLPRSDLRIGVARIHPAEWGLNEGMGPCGVAAIVVESGATKNAYIVFDSNNMIQGMREEILSQVSSLGFEAEVMTSDTHLVNAIGATDRGYHPAGEVMDHAAVLRHVEELLGSTVTTPATASFTRLSVDGVPIIGNKGIELLREVVKTSFQVFIRTASAVLPFSFLTALAVALLA